MAPRTSMMIAAALMLGGLLALSACGGTSSPSGPSATSSTSATPPPTPTPASVPTVTLDDNGYTIQLNVGERFLLDLAESFDWTVQVADQSVLSRLVNVAVIRGAQGLYEAKKPGSTELTATGDPPCRKAQPPCAAPSIVFRITVVVAG